MTTQGPVDARLVLEKASAELDLQLAGIIRLENGEAEAIADACEEFDAWNWFQKFWHTFDREEWIRGRKWDYWTWKRERELKQRKTSVRACEGLIHLANATTGDIMMSRDDARFLRIDEDG